MIKRNLHSHTQFCDGKAPMAEMVRAAFNAGFDVWGFSPHSPIPILSPCNMKHEDVPDFIAEAKRLKTLYRGKMEILTGMEIDYLSADSGPSINYYQDLPLDYRIGSVHFVPTQTGELVDCDGNAERFKAYLHSKFNDDLEYVVKNYFSQIIEMIQSGGFDIIGHIDKIAGNASAVDPNLENQPWYRDLLLTAMNEAVANNLIIEINTKAYHDRKRFYPSLYWWQTLKNIGAEVIFSTDAHRPEKVDAGFLEAVSIWSDLKTPFPNIC